MKVLYYNLNTGTNIFYVLGLDQNINSS